MNFWIKTATILMFCSIVYVPLVNGYFSHDEWQSFLDFYLLSKQDYVYGVTSFFLPQPGQYTPISISFTYTIFRLFGLSYKVYFLIGIVLHTLSSFVLTVWIYQLIQKKWPSLLGGILFMIAPHHFQATSWVVANIGYSLSLIFLILGLIFFFNLFKKKKNKYAFWSSLFFFLSLLNKEISAFILLILPLITFFWGRRKFKTYLSDLAIVTVPSLTLIIWHYWYLKAHPVLDYSIQYSSSLQSLFTLPIRSVVQSILPQNIIYFLAKILLFPFPPYNLEKLQTTSFNILVESNGALAITILGFILVVLSSILMHKKSRKYFKIYLFGLILAFTSGWTYYFVDSSSFALLQPRYVYAAIIGVCLSVSVLFIVVGQKLKVLIILFIAYFSFLTFTQSIELSKIGEERHTILKEIKKSIPSGSKNTLIYTESDSSFYGLPDNIKILPFQASAPKVLAAYLQDKIYLPKEIYEYLKLRPLDSQGYFKDNFGSYGYFRDYSSLLSTVRQKKVDIKNIYAFKYNSSQKKITNITDRVRQKIVDNLKKNEI